jgi:amidase
MQDDHAMPLEADGLSRRGFLKTGLAASVAGLIASVPEVHALASPSASVTVPAPDLEEVSIDALRGGMERGEFSARSIVEGYLDRIGKIDRSGPELRSVIELNPDALDIADALDRERREKVARGPLHGIPVLIKDNIDTADRMATTAGSLALVGSRPTADAFIVQRLRSAGAIILGKTNLSEWANIRSSRSTSGWSGRGGLTCNPYALDRNTSGSSSGSGVAVSANLCALAVGTETDGSIVSPSSVNGIVGIKPTVGLVSRTGIIPISHSQDTAGPMARTVRDAAILLGVLAGADAEDPATAGAHAKGLPDYAAALVPGGLKGARIGVVRKYFGFHPAVDKVMENVLVVLKREGAVLVDPADVPTLGKFEQDEFTVLLYELKHDLNAYLDRVKATARVHSLNDVIAFNDEHRDTEMQYFGQETFLKAEAKGPLTAKEYRTALANCRRLSRRDGIDAVMNKHRLDALLAPTESPAWVTDLVLSDHFIGGSSTAAAVAGYPSITVPAGFVFGLPVGVSFFGRAWTEAKLITLAYGFEQATKARRKPAYAATAEVGLVSQ